MIRNAALVLDLLSASPLPSVFYVLGGRLSLAPENVIGNI